jgi:hypothetical protein
MTRALEILFATPVLVAIALSQLVDTKVGGISVAFDFTEKN